MAAPTVAAVGADSGGSLAAITPAFPAGITAGDILIGVGESESAEFYPTIDTNGFVHVTGSPVVNTNSRLSVVWARYDGVMTAHSWGDSGNHNHGRYIAIRGCPSSGNPWNVVQPATENTSDTSATWPGVTTTVTDCLVLEIISTGTDVASTAQVGALTNAAYTSITEQMDNWVSTGLGGGFGMVSGIKATAGATGQSTATITTAATKALMTLAMAPAPPAAGPPELVMAPPFN